MIASPISATLLAVDSAHGKQVPLFFTQIVLLILVGRLLGEWMQRKGQPAVIGQLLAGILLGPSVFGTIWPTAQEFVFPSSATDRPMLTAVAELGVLLLLLLTGMETDMSIIRKAHRIALITSAAGIVLPFSLGYLFGQSLPDSLIADPNLRMISSLFIATALSISSVKIVAAVLQEVDYLKRNLGQVILATALLDDTAGWTILGLISGLASKGVVEFWPLLFKIAAIVVFLWFTFTIGRRWIALAIRWTNDHFVSEMPVISAILIITILMALLTNQIGVHTVLGSFVAGVVIGQSPILTKHIQEELRGLIVALFAPVFFGVAGLSIDLKVLQDPQFLIVAVLFIGIASIGKFGGCYLGSRLARMSHPEALAVGFAMNARGSTEIILAAIGLSMGVLNLALFTLIVLMAVVTTVAMPPLLRLALKRVPLRQEERVEIEKEAAERKDLMPKLERLLAVIDRSDAGQFSAYVLGCLIGARRLSTTVMEVDRFGGSASAAPSSSQTLIKTAISVADSLRGREEAQTGRGSSSPLEVAGEVSDTQNIAIEEIITSHSLNFAPQTPNFSDAILLELRKGYELSFFGVEIYTPKRNSPSSFPGFIEKIVHEFEGPSAIMLFADGNRRLCEYRISKILVPTIGTDYSHFGVEIAVAIARGAGATVTALHVSSPSGERHATHALLNDAVEIGTRSGVEVNSQEFIAPYKSEIISRKAISGHYDLVVLGGKLRSGEKLNFGRSVAELFRKPPCPVIIVKF